MTSHKPGPARDKPRPEAVPAGSNPRTAGGIPITIEPRENLGQDTRDIEFEGHVNPKDRRSKRKREWPRLSPFSGDRKWSLP